MSGNRKRLTINQEALLRDLEDGKKFYARKKADTGVLNFSFSIDKACNLYLTLTLRSLLARKLVKVVKDKKWSPNKFDHIFDIEGIVELIK